MSAQDLLEALAGKQEGSPALSDSKAVRAVAWARVSTDMQEERGLSMPEQLREIRLYAEQRGIEIVAEYFEAASAYQKDSKRPEFNKMLARAKSTPGVSVILVHDFSRFSRDSVGAKALVRELRKSGIKVLSLNDPDIDPESVAGVYMEAITFAKNEAYSREVAFHTRKGCRANIQARDTETGSCYKNGGQPLWGYRTERLVRGQERGGRPILKSIWMLDDTVVSGRPIHEWVRHCLVELAARGATLDELRDFCNEKGLPARRGSFWNSSTWNSLLSPSALLEYCGYGVWNVHRKDGSEKPASEWVVVEKAHPAIITAEEAKAISAVRKGAGRKGRFDKGSNRAGSSPYLLSGGIFKCGRCGSNMTGFRVSGGRYYVCGSMPYRRGMGCGRGVYVPQDYVEGEVVSGIEELLDRCTDAEALTRSINGKLGRIWGEKSGHDPEAEKKITAVDTKIDNVRKAVEGGLSDVSWANTRLEALKAERGALARQAVLVGELPKLDAGRVTQYARQTAKVLSHSNPKERKKLVRAWVGEMKMAPESREVEITYRIPEPFMNSMVAGAGFEPAIFRL